MSLYNENEGTYISNKPDWISYYPISDNELINYGLRTCDMNAFKLAIKFEKLKPHILMGYRMATMPCEYKMENPHFAVLVKDKVWEITLCLEKGMRYSVSDKKQWLKYHGFRYIEDKELLEMANMNYFWRHYLRY